MRVLLLLFLLPAVAYAQPRGTINNKKKVDSVDYYDERMRSMERFADSVRRQLLDSVRLTEAYKELERRRAELMQHSDRYFSFDFFAEVADADFDKLNSTLVPKGFSKMANGVFRLGFGITIKEKAWLCDVAYAIGGFSEVAKKGDEEVKASFSSFLQADVGYDFIRSPGINLYPYAGIALRTSRLKYSTPSEVNGNYSDITDLIDNQRSVSDRIYKLGYQAGIGFEISLLKDAKKTNGEMIFVKLGTNGIVGKERYKLGGVTYDPGIRYGKWIVAVGVKIFNRY
ncbi:MAG: hypothetical protein QM731_12225 [Chitinophagaceae bacterium]